MTVLLASIVIAGGCASGSSKVVSSGTVGTAATAEPTGTVVATGTTEPTDPTPKPAKVEKAERVAMEQRAGGVDLLPPPAVKTTIPAETKLTAVITDIDARHEWVGRKFASIVDTADKAFGEPRVEDAEQIVRAKIGLKAKVIQTEETDWSVPSNFRIPLPALARRANVFIDLATDSDASNLSDVNAATEDKKTSL